MADMLPPIVGYVRMDVAQAIAGMEALKASTVASTDASRAAMTTWNKDTTDATNAVTTGLLAVGGGLAVAAGASIDMAAKFETSTTRLLTSAGFAKEDVGALRQGILDMAGQVGDSADQLSHAMYVVGSAGITQVGPALEVMRAGAEGAKAENADLSVVLNAVTSAMADYHLGADKAALTTSQLITAVSMGKTTFQELTGSLHSVLPEASAMHVPLSDILGDLASMTEHGISSSQATDDLNHSLQHLQTITAPQAKELALLGLNARQLADDLGSSKGLSGAFQEIAKRITDSMGPDKQHVVLDMATALRGLPPAVEKMGEAVINGSMSLGDFTKSAKGLSVEQAGLVHQFASLETSTHGIGSAQQSGAQVMQTYAAALKAATGDSTTLSTALMLTGENADYTNKAVSSVAGAATEAGGHVKGWADIQSTFNQKLAEAKDGADAAAISMGTRLLPLAGQALGVFAAHIPDVIAVGNKLVDVAVAAGALAGKMGPLLPVIGAALGLFVAWKTAMTIGAAIEGVVTMVQAFAGTLAVLSAAEGEATVAQWLLNTAMAANPVGLVVLGIAALIGAIALLATHWKMVTDALHAFWAKIQQAAGTVVSFIGHHHTLAAAVTFLTGPIGFLVGVIRDLVSHWHQVEQAMSGPLKSALSAIHSLFGTVGKAVADAGHQLAPIGKELSKAGGEFSQAGHQVGSMVSGLLKSLAPLLPVVKTIFTGIAIAVGVALGIVATVMGALLSGAFKGLIAALMVALPGAIHAAVTVIDIIVTVIKTVADIVSGVVKIVSDILSGHWSAAWNDAKQLVMNVAGDLGHIVGDLFDLIGTIISTSIGTILAFLQGFVFGVIGFFQWLFHQLVGGSIIPDLVNQTVQWFEQLPGRILGVLEGLVSSVAGAAGRIGSAILNGITGALSGLGGAIEGAVKGAVSHIPGGEAALHTLGIPGFAAGGRVPGPLGAPRLIVAHGGEVVVPADIAMGAQSAGSIAGPSSSAGAPGLTGPSMDDTNDLLAQLYQLLDERLPRSSQATFRNRAYRPA